MCMYDDLINVINIRCDQRMHVWSAENDRPGKVKLVLCIAPPPTVLLQLNKFISMPVILFG